MVFTTDRFAVQTCYAMYDLRLIRFVAGHTIELQGLRTALVGACCLVAALWSVAFSLWRGGEVAPQVVFWLPLLLLAWHVDERLAAYYRIRLGIVTPQHPAKRLVALGVIASAYVSLRVLELRIEQPIAFSALFIGAVQFHIGLISSKGYRPHYILGALIWVALALVPQVALSQAALAVFWLAAIGLTFALLGWRDHQVLMRSVCVQGDTTDVEVV
jgi:hypothetical protein